MAAPSRIADGQATSGTTMTYLMKSGTFTSDSKPQPALRLTYAPSIPDRRGTAARAGRASHAGTSVTVTSAASITGV